MAAHSLGQRLGLWLSTGLGFGYFPKGPGTAGTLWGVLLYFAFRGFSDWQFIAATLVLIGISIAAVYQAQKILGPHDSPHIVIDEIVGYLVTVATVPFSWKHALAGFILFRFFDIAKPFPIRWFDRNVKGALGVVLDDLVAGVIACLVLRVILHFWVSL